MRHFLLSPSISALPVRVRPSALAAGLIATARRTERPAPRLFGAARAAVAVPVITSAAEEKDLPARRQTARDESQRFQAPSARARLRSGPPARSVRSPYRWITSALLDSASRARSANSGPSLFGALPRPRYDGTSTSASFRPLTSAPAERPESRASWGSLTNVLRRQVKDPRWAQSTG